MSNCLHVWTDTYVHEEEKNFQAMPSSVVMYSKCSFTTNVTEKCVKDESLQSIILFLTCFYVLLLSIQTKLSSKMKGQDTQHVF